MQQLNVKIYLEDAFTPVNDVKIKLIPLNVKDSAKPKDEPQEQISNNGEAIFTIPANAYQFEFEIFDERFYSKAKNDMVRVTNNYKSDSTISLILLSKPRLYFNGKELFISNGNKVLDYFKAYSGNALKIEEREKLEKQYGYKNFVSYKDMENNIFYFCLDKEWQQEKDKGAIPEGKYYVDINQSRDDKSSGIREYQNKWLSVSRSNEGEVQWGKYNIPIYTNKDCTNTIESSTQRNAFYIHGGDQYGNNGGIDIGKESKELINKLEILRNKLLHTNPNLKDKPIVIELLVDYTPLCIRLESLGLERMIEQENSKHKVILSSIYSDKPKEISKEAFNIQKQQTYWGYKEIEQAEEFNFNGIRMKDITLFKKEQKDYMGENIEINLVKYDWQHCNKQIIVFGFLDIDRSIDSNGYEIIKNPKWRIITWHNPIVNPRVTLFSFNGRNDRIEIAMFGYFTQRKVGKNTKGTHQGIDFFAKEKTKLYAPLDCEVVSTNFSNSYGNTITLKVTESSLEILKIRRAFINYQLHYVAYKKDGSIDKENSEIEREDFNEKSKAYYLFYAHLSQVNVKKGNKVVAGQVIGLSGISGNAKGTKAPHLHFEIRDNDNVGMGLSNRINPAFYIEFKKLYSEFSKEEKQEQQEACGKYCKLPTK